MDMQISWLEWTFKKGLGGRRNFLSLFVCLVLLPIAIKEY